MKAGPSASSGSVVHLSLLLAIFSIATPAPMVPEIRSTFSDVEKLTKPVTDVRPLSPVDDTGPAIHGHPPPSPVRTGKLEGLVTNGHTPMPPISDAQKLSEPVTDGHPLPSPASDPIRAAEAGDATQHPLTFVKNAKSADLNTDVAPKAPEVLEPVTIMGGPSKKRKVVVFLDHHTADGLEQTPRQVAPTARLPTNIKLSVEPSAPLTDNLASSTAKKVSEPVTDSHTHLPPVSDSQKLSDRVADSHPLPSPTGDSERVVERIDSPEPATDVGPLLPVKNTGPAIHDDSPTFPGGTFKSSKPATHGHTPLSPVSDAHKVSELFTNHHPRPMPTSDPERLAEPVTDTQHNPFVVPVNDASKTGELNADLHTAQPTVSDAPGSDTVVRNAPQNQGSAATKAKDVPDVQTAHGGTSEQPERPAPQEPHSSENAKASVEPSTYLIDDHLAFNNAKKLTEPATEAPLLLPVKNAGRTVDGHSAQFPTGTFKLSEMVTDRHTPLPPASDAEKLSELIADGHQPLLTSDSVRATESETNRSPPLAVNNADNAGKNNADPHTTQPTFSKAPGSTAQPTVSKAPESDAIFEKAPQNTGPTASKAEDVLDAPTTHFDTSEQLHGPAPPKPRSSENGKAFTEPSAPPASDLRKVSEPIADRHAPLGPVINDEKTVEPTADVDTAQPTVSEDSDNTAEPTVSKAPEILEPAATKAEVVPEAHIAHENLPEQVPAPSSPAARSSPGTGEIDEAFSRLMNVKPKPPPVPATPSMADYCRRYWSRLKEIFVGLGSKIKKWWFRRSEESTARGIDILQSRAKPKEN